jgi:hypothetical protein
VSLQNTATKRNDEEKQFQLMENFHKFRPSRHSQRASTAFFQFFCVRRLWREKGGNEWGLYVAQVSVEFEAQDWLLTVDFGRHDEQFNSGQLSSATTIGTQTTHKPYKETTETSSQQIAAQS